eukprot:6215788-Lingulodinium_polyedra.AAC.1
MTWPRRRPCYRASAYTRAWPHSAWAGRGPSTSPTRPWRPEWQPPSKAARARLCERPSPLLSWSRADA